MGRTSRPSRLLPVLVVFRATVSSGVSPILSSSVFSALSRQTFRGTARPGVVADTAFCSSCGESTFFRSNSMMMSPETIPAFAAGPSCAMSEIRTPFGSFSPKPFASSGLSAWMDTPSHPRVILPLAASSV